MTLGNMRHTKMQALSKMDSKFAMSKMDNKKVNALGKFEPLYRSLYI